MTRSQGSQGVKICRWASGVLAHIDCDTIPITKVNYNIRPKKRLRRNIALGMGNYDVFLGMREEDGSEEAMKVRVEKQESDGPYDTSPPDHLPR